MNNCIFLTTRYGSTRLPGKALLEINGETVTDILIKRLKKAAIPIIMCTPDTPEDNRYMKPIAERHGIGFFCGEKENIIKRHKQCAEKYGVEWIIEVDGDDILLCPEVIIAVSYKITHIEHQIPIKTTGLPLGLNVLAYPAKILDKIDYKSSTNWGAQIVRDGYYEVKFNYDLLFSLTMDYLEDFELIRDILTNCKRNQLVRGICSYLIKHPEIARINHKRNKERLERWGIKFEEEN